MGIGESMVDQLLTRLRLSMDQGLDLDFVPGQAGGPAVRSRRYSSGLIDEAEALIRGEFGKYIYGTDGESIAGIG